MERWQGQEQLSHLVNIEALLGRLNNGQAQPQPSTIPSARVENTQKLIPLDLSWPREAVSSKLKDRLETSVAHLNTPSKLLNLNAQPDRIADEASAVRLNRILEIFVTDVLAARDKLLMLNPGRRKMIEHRLEFIARKIARNRGERLNRSLSLPEILRESYRDPGLSGLPTSTPPKLGIAAWRGFVSEVALYNLLQLFFLKCLDVYQLREFESTDLGRMNFAAHTFLSQRAAGFAQDIHCWNFVRTNLYSWYVPSQKALLELSRALENFEFAWSDRDLLKWIKDLPQALQVPHLEFGAEARIGEMIRELLETQLATPVTTNYQGRVACRKFFFPALELGGVAQSVLDKLLIDLNKAAPQGYDGGILDESTLVHRAIWACEMESFEVFWTEVVSLLKLIRAIKSQAQGFGEHQNLNLAPTDQSQVCLYRLPHAAHAVQALGLELHNLEQLPLGGPEVSKMHQGSASQIQQIESFDVAVVNDHPDRQKSAAWVKALTQQLPYWRNIVGSATNLNWGELHLYLAATKLRENGYCIYLSHRTLPEGGDGEKLRRALLSLGTLEYFVELGEEAYQPYRYLYIFKRESRKLERDSHHPRFGKMKGSLLDLGLLEEASATQAEIAERGWDHLFVRGAAPLIRHLNHKFPKLFQVATVQLATSEAPSRHFFGSDVKALEGTPDVNSATGGAIKFSPLSKQPGRESILVFPHNPADLPWLACLLNSGPAQFWIRQQIIAAANGKAPKLQELRSCPIVDLSHAPTDLVHSALEWMEIQKPDAQTMRSWVDPDESPLTERYSKYVAAAKRYTTLEKTVSRYRPLFANGALEELKPEAVTQFYPSSLLCHLSQSPDLRIQYAERNRSNLMPDNWTIDEVHCTIQDIGGKRMAYIAVQTRQGPVIQILVPSAIRDYVYLQLKSLRAHSWGEALSVLKIPRDIPLFAAQAAEITRVVSDTAREMAIYHRALEEMVMDLFEIPADVRQFLPH